MEEVEEERISPEGKKFDSDFQMEMAATTWNRAKKRKASSEMVQPMNVLSSQDEDTEEYMNNQAELLLLTLASMQQQDETPLGC